MAVYTKGAQARRTALLEDYSAPLSDVLRASARVTLLESPTSSVARLSELQQAEAGRVTREYVPGEGFTFRREAPDSAVLPADQAKQRAKDAGVDLEIPEDGIRERALEILLERKQARRRLDDVLNRAPEGLTPTALKFGVALGASLLDPMNVASAFIPVVGPARYAKLLRSASGPGGRALVRSGVGAVEGVVGAAVVEPFVLAAAQQEQSDYGLADSLLNITFGAAFGGVLHAGGGVISDAVVRSRTAADLDRTAAARVAQAPSRDQRAALEAAVGQLASGRQVEVDRLFELRDEIAKVQPQTLADARKLAIADLKAELRAEVQGPADDLPYGARAEASPGPTDRAEVPAGPEGQAPQEPQAQRVSQEQASRTAKPDSAQGPAGRWRALVETEAEVDEVLRALDRGEVPEKFQAEIEEVAQQILDDYAAARVPEITQTPEAVNRAYARLKDQARNYDAARNYRLADMDTAERHRAEVKAAGGEDPDAELEVAMDRLTEALDAFEGEAQMELQAADENVVRAEEYGGSLRAAALCTLRKGG